MADSGNGKSLLVGISDKLIRALPPAFLLLVLLNIVFLGVASYVFQHNTELRNAAAASVYFFLEHHSPYSEDVHCQ